MADELLEFVNATNGNGLCTRNETSFVKYYLLADSLSKTLDKNPVSPEEMYRCQRCHKSFKYKTSLIQHSCEIVTPKRFCCKECGKLLARKSSLIGHMRIHTGEKPFQCTVCGKAFTHKHHLSSHMHTHKE